MPEPATRTPGATRPRFCRTCGDALVWRKPAGRRPPELICLHGHRRRPSYGLAAQRLRPAIAEPTSILELTSPARPAAWGYAPLLSVVAASGLVIASTADRMASLDQPWANELFWLAALTIFVPIAARLFMAGVSRRESVALVSVLALALYLLKVLNSPWAFTYHDELIHWRTADDIIRTGHLFSLNPMLPASPTYPALEAATSALVQAGGLPIFDAGLIVVGLSRLALVLALYLSFELLARSRRVAALSVVVYMTHANFVFLNASFKYETIGLAFAVLAIYFTILWARARPQGRWRLMAAAVLAALATASAHHLSAVALVGLLGAWSVAAWILPGARRRQRWRPPWRIFVASLAVSATWLILVAPATVGYLAPVVGGAIGGGFRLIASKLGWVQADGVERTIIPVGDEATWERIIALVAVVIVSTALAAGAWQVARRYVRSPFVVTFAFVVPAYPISLILRLTDAGWETANRSSEFLYVAFALPIALGLVALISLVRKQRYQLLVVSAIACVLLIGGIRSGWEYDDRLPRPYKCCDLPRAVGVEGVNTALWARGVFDAETRVGAEQVNHLLLGSYGASLVMSTLSGGINPNWVLFSPTFDADKIELLRQGRVEYLLVDDRVATAPEAFREYLGQTPIRQALAKYDAAGLDRVYDSGSIHIYRVDALWRLGG